jgi:hypothetical protein
MFLSCCTYASMMYLKKALAHYAYLNSQAGGGNLSEADLAHQQRIRHR